MKRAHLLHRPHHLRLVPPRHLHCSLMVTLSYQFHALVSMMKTLSNLEETTEQDMRFRMLMKNEERKTTNL